LRAPVPWPGKILCSTAVYAPEAAAQRQQLLMTLKSAESVIGPGETIRLPDVSEPWTFVPQAALGLVIRGPSKRVAADAWRSAVFGYTCTLDVMARGDPQFGRDYWLAKADTLGPLGPAIVTTDEIPDPSGLRVRSWQNGLPAQDFCIADASHAIGEQVELATTVMTLYSGDVLACGTSPEGPRPLADGDTIDVEIDAIGRLSLKVAALARSGA
jgi:2-keto-4-pentenoate hydratase/2-oxohepta-3-ene-1,7-dioic acid hydratase in catechol pathway